MTDGFFNKRSYLGGKHDSLGAAVAIIGSATGKVIDIEVQNKFCYVCRKYQNLKLDPPEHKCYMNYDREKSSSSMEPSATVKLFQRSLELHGIAYHVMVSDDDSKTYNDVIEADPYASLKIKVKRIRCTNHLFRAMGTKIRKISKLTIPNKRVPGSVRKRIKFSGVKIRKIITSDIERLKKEFEADNLSKQEKLSIFKKNTEILRNNIELAHHHAFGNHEKCPVEWSCDNSDNSDKSSKDHVTQLKKYDFFP